VIAAALLAGVLVQIRPQPSPGVVQAGDKYGEVREGPLDDVARENGNYQKAHVRTRGRLGMVSGYYSLTDGGAQLLLLLGHGLDVNEVQRRLGSEIEARGIVRRIRTKEYVNGVDKDLIEDRDLPVLPAPHVSLPRVSLTLLGFSEIEFTGRRDADRMSQRAPFEAILADPGRFADKPIKVIGRRRTGSSRTASTRSGSRERNRRARASRSTRATRATHRAGSRWKASRKWSTASCTYGRPRSTLRSDAPRRSSNKAVAARGGDCYTLVALVAVPLPMAQRGRPQWSAFGL
jgi:hypothetical protein